MVVSESVESVESVVAGLDSMVVGLALVVGFGGCWVGLGGGFRWWSFQWFLWCRTTAMGGGFGYVGLMEEERGERDVGV